MRGSIRRAALCVAGCFLALVAAAVQAETPAVRFRVTTVPVPLPHIEIQGMNNRGIIVGNLLDSGTGFVYDSRGAVLGANSFHSITEFVTIPAGWLRASCVDINDSGIVVGVFERQGTGGTERQGFILDLNTRGVTSTPNPWNAAFTYGRRINNAGVILGYYGADFSAHTAYLYETATQHLTIVKDPATDAPLAVIGLSLELSNQNQIAGMTNDGSSSFRLTTPAGLLEMVPLSNGGRINDLGTVAGQSGVSSGKGKNQTYASAALYTGSTQIVGPAGSETFSQDLNNAADVLVWDRSKSTLYRPESGLIDFYPLVTHGSTQADLDFWNAAKNTSPIIAVRIAERDTALGTGTTGYAAIGAFTSVTTGKGKNTSSETRLIILTPEAP